MYLANKTSEILTPTLVEKFAVVNTRNGKGIVATTECRAGEPLLRFTGEIRSLDAVPDAQLAYVVRVDRDQFMIPNAPTRFVNHSCEPNCRIDDDWQVVPRRTISPGEEITIAYNRVRPDELEEWGDFWHEKWTFACRCGARQCCGMIDRYVVNEVTPEISNNDYLCVETSTEDFEDIVAVASQIQCFTADEVACLATDLKDQFDSLDSLDQMLTLKVGGKTSGFCHFGPLPITDRSWIMFWILVDPSTHSAGMGRTLVAEMERRIAQENGRLILIETSDHDDFAGARRFYERAGYELVATIPDYYTKEQGKCVFSKRIGGEQNELIR